MRVEYHGDMSTLSLCYPVAPHRVNRAWGVTDPLYAEYGFKKHNGVDLALSDGQDVRAPFDCKVTLVGSQPKGSGNFVCVVSREKYEFADGISAHVEMTFMHLKESKVHPGQRLGIGDLVALGGKTGRTTGAHLHLAPKRVKKSLLGYRDLDQNDADNTFDPEPYWNGTYARRKV